MLGKGHRAGETGGVRRAYHAHKRTSPAVTLSEPRRGGRGTETPEGLFLPPHGLPVGSAGTLGSRTGAGSRAPAGSVGAGSRGLGGAGRRGHGSAGGADSRRVRIRHGASPQDSVRTLASPHTAGAGRGGCGAQAGAPVCRGVLLFCFSRIRIRKRNALSESATNKTIVHESATTESEPATENPQETKQSLANPHTAQRRLNRGTVIWERRTLQKLLQALNGG